MRVFLHLIMFFEFHLFYTYMIQPFVVRELGLQYAAVSTTLYWWLPIFEGNQFPCHCTLGIYDLTAGSWA